MKYCFLDGVLELWLTKRQDREDGCRSRTEGVAIGRYLLGLLIELAINFVSIFKAAVR
jgi:hypothetical protein